MLDGLVGGAVFADTDGVVGEAVDDGDFHDGGEAYRTAGVVGEDEEARAEGSDLGERHAVDDGSHGELADAVVEVAAGVVVGLEVAGFRRGDAGFSGGVEIGRAADEPGDIFGDGVEDFAVGLAGSEAFFVGGEDGEVFVPTLGQLAMLHLVEFVGEVGVGGFEFVEQVHPFARRSPPRLPMVSLK